MLRSLVGSVMCIIDRLDRPHVGAVKQPSPVPSPRGRGDGLSFHWFTRSI
jgi:hypothetical protein